MFRLAAQGCDASLEGAWMIGDSAEADISGRGSRNRQRLDQPGRSWPPLPYQPTAVADSVEAAVAYIFQFDASTS